MDCPSCAKTIQANLVLLPGVEKASVNFASGKLTVSYDPSQVEERVISDRVMALGYTVEVEIAPSQTLQAQIGGMDCGSCAKTIEASLQQMPGVNEAAVSFATGRLTASYDPSQVNEEAIHSRISNLGYTVEQTPSLPDAHSQDGVASDPNFSEPSAIKKTQKLSLTGWKFWLFNRRGQSVVLAGVGLVLGLLAQQLYQLAKIMLHIVKKPLWNKSGLCQEW
jgi:Cd2+/Zn2+-exporting ATPase